MIQEAKTPVKKAGVIGHPIAQSKSPIIHHYWMDKHGIDASYTAHDIASENLEKDVRSLFQEGYLGLNVTVPHKEKIIDLCDDIDGAAKAIGAVNTLLCQDGKVKGFNTDAYGFLKNLEAQCNTENLKDKKTLILGAGGAAKACLYALSQNGFENLTLSNRTKKRAEALQNNFQFEILDWEEKDQNLEDFGLIVNTTSLGMKAQAPLDFCFDDVSKSAVIYDIVYNPLITDFLKRAQQKNLKIVTGIGMLLYQAALSFDIWFGVKPDIDEALQKKVLRP